VRVAWDPMFQVVRKLEVSVKRSSTVTFEPGRSTLGIPIRSAKTYRHGSGLWVVAMRGGGTGI